MQRALRVPPYLVDRGAVAAETEAILRHPDFGEARSRYAAAGLDRFDGDPRAAKMMCQVARYTLALAILHLESSAGPDGPGASAAQLRAMLTAGEFASAGWVKHAVRVFHRVGYLDRQPSRDDRRFKRIVPSAEMVSLAVEAMALMLHAVDCVAALPLPAAELARTPGFIGAAASHTIVPYLADGFSPLEAYPEIRRLVLHDFGFVVLCWLIRSARRTADGALVAQAPSVVLSRRFGMSRAQARSVLMICREAGGVLAMSRGGHQVALSPQFADLCDRWVAHDLACWSRIVRAAARDLGLGVASRRRRPDLA
jgi:hypothetical protein